MSNPSQQDLQKLSGIKQLLGRWISELRTRFEELKEEVRYADNHEFLVEHAKKLAKLMATLQIERKNSAASLTPMLKQPPPKSMPPATPSASAPPPRPPPPLPRVAGLKLKSRKRGSSQAIKSDMLVAARKRMSVRGEGQIAAISGELKSKFVKPTTPKPQKAQKPKTPPPKRPGLPPPTPPKKPTVPHITETSIEKKINKIEKDLSERAALRSSAPVKEETRLRKSDSVKDGKKPKGKSDKDDKKKDSKEDKKKESKEDKKKDKEDKSHKNKDKKKKDKARKAERLTKSADCVDSDPELLSAPDSIKKLVKNGNKGTPMPLVRSNSSDVSAKMKHKRLNTPKGKRKHKPVGAIDWDPGTDIVF